MRRNWIKLFQALADPTRRAVLERLSGGAASTLELARPFDMTLPSFTQHLSMLEKIGLVKSRKAGRVRTYELAAKRLQAAEDWILGSTETLGTSIGSVGRLCDYDEGVRR